MQGVQPHGGLGTTSGEMRLPDEESDANRFGFPGDERGHPINSFHWGSDSKRISITAVPVWLSATLCVDVHRAAAFLPRSGL